MPEKLLFDNNISHRIVPRIEDIFPGSTHVMTEDLDEASDMEVWSFAKINRFTIVSKDSDFNDLSIFYGHPPKVIWIRIGNCRVGDIESLLRSHYDTIKRFLSDSEAAILEL